MNNLVKTVKEPPQTIAELIARVRENVGGRNCCLKRILKRGYTRDREKWFITGALAVLYCFDIPEAMEIIEEWTDDLASGRRPGSKTPKEEQGRALERIHRVATLGNNPRFIDSE